MLENTDLVFIVGYWVALIIGVTLDGAVAFNILKLKTITMPTSIIAVVGGGLILAVMIPATMNHMSEMRVKILDMEFQLKKATNDITELSEDLAEAGTEIDTLQKTMASVTEQMDVLDSGSQRTQQLNRTYLMSERVMDGQAFERPGPELVFRFAHEYGGKFAPIVDNVYVNWFGELPSALKLFQEVEFFFGKSEYSLKREIGESYKDSDPVSGTN